MYAFSEIYPYFLWGVATATARSVLFSWCEVTLHLLSLSSSWSPDSSLQHSATTTTSKRCFVVDVTIVCHSSQCCSIVELRTISLLRLCVCFSPFLSVLLPQKDDDDDDDDDMCTCVCTCVQLMYSPCMPSPRSPTNEVGGIDDIYCVLSCDAAVSVQCNDQLLLVVGCPTPRPHTLPPLATLHNFEGKRRGRNPHARTHTHTCIHRPFSLWVTLTLHQTEEKGQRV